MSLGKFIGEFKALSVYAIAGIVSSGVPFLLMPVLTRYLDPGDYGSLAIYNATLRLITIILSFGGFHILISRFSETDFLRNGVYIGSFLWLIIKRSILLFSFFIVVNQFFSGILGVPSAMLLALVPIAFAILVYDSSVNYLAHCKEIKDYSIVFFGKVSIEVVLVFLLIVYLGFGWFGRVLSVFFGILCVVPFVVLFFRRKRIKIEFPKRGKGKQNELLRLGMPLVLVDLSTMVINLSDRYFIDYYVGLDQTGIYSVGYVIGGTVNIAIIAAINVIRPRFYKYFFEIGKRKKMFIQHSVSYLIFLVLTYIGIELCYPIFLDRFISAEYTAASNYVTITAIGFVFWGVYCLTSIYHIFFNLQKQIALISISAIFFNILLNSILIPRFGAMGAAYATLITFMALSLIGVLIVGIHLIKPQK